MKFILLHRAWLIWVALVLGLILRLTYITLVPTIPHVPDSKWYVETAINLAAGHGYSIGGKPTAAWPIGYPAMLGALFVVFGPSLLAAKIANVIFYAASIWLAYRISQFIFKSELAALLVALLLAIYPNHIAYSAEYMTESLFLLLSLLSIYMCLIARQSLPMLVLAGVVAGLAVLVKPQFLFVPLIVLTVSYFDGEQTAQRWKQLAIQWSTVYIAICLVLTPWTIRNYMVFKQLVFISTNGGLAMFIGVHPDVVRDSLDSAILPNNIRETYGQMVNQDEHAADQWIRAQALQSLLKEPAATTRQISRQIFYMWHTDIDGIRLNEQNLDFTALGMTRDAYSQSQLRATMLYFKLLALAFYGASIVLTIVAIARVLYQRQRSVLWWLGAILAGYYSLLAIFFHGESRYHFPVMPWIVMYSAVGLTYIALEARTVLGWLSQRRKKSVLGPNLSTSEMKEAEHDGGPSILLGP